jgi:hypothetical protein
MLTLMYRAEQDWSPCEDTEEKQSGLWGRHIIKEDLSPK